MPKPKLPKEQRRVKISVTISPENFTWIQSHGIRSELIDCLLSMARRAAGEPPKVLREIERLGKKR